MFTESEIRYRVRHHLREAKLRNEISKNYESQKFIPATDNLLFLDRTGNENEYDSASLKKISDFYKKMELISELALPLKREVYGGLESAIAGSGFWNHDNSADGPESIRGFGSVLQTDAARILGNAVQNYFDSIKLPITVVAWSIDDTALKKDISSKLQNNENPNRFIVAAQAALSKAGRGQLLLFAINSAEDFDPSLVSAQKIASNISITIRHELVHDKQYVALASAKGITRLEAKQQFTDWGLIPPPDESRENYLSSHIEIDAFGHEFAESLAAELGIDEAQRLVATADITELQTVLRDSDLSDNLKEYYLEFGDSKFIANLHKKIRKYLRLMKDEGVY